MRRIVIAGSTGSIGTQALDVVSRSRDLEVVALAAGSNDGLLVEQAAQFGVGRIGLADELVALERVRPRAIELAQEIAGSAPIAVRSTRATVRGNLVEQVRLAVARESMEQNQHFLTEDFKEGVAAMAERRPPQFKGR